MPQSPAVVDILLKDIDLKGGTNESFRKEALDWTKYFTKAENLVIDSYGALTKRPGRGAMGPGPVDDDGDFFTKYHRAFQSDSGLSIAAADESAVMNLYRYNEAKDTITNKGRLPEFSVTQKSLPSSHHNSTSIFLSTGMWNNECSGIVEVGDYLVVAVKSSSLDSYMYVMDKDSLSVIREYSFGDSHLYLCKVGTDVHIYVQEPAGQSFYRYQTSSFTLSAATALASSSGVRAIAGAVGLPDGSGSVVAYGLDSVDTRFQKFNAAGVSAATATLNNSVITDIAVDGNSQVHAVGYETVSGQVIIARYNSSLVHQATDQDTLALAGTYYDCLRIAVNSAGTDGRILAYTSVTLAPAAVQCCEVWIYEAGGAISGLVGVLPMQAEACLPFYTPSGGGRYYVALTKMVFSTVGVGGGANTTSNQTYGRTVLVDITEHSNTAIGATEPMFRPVASLGGYTNISHIADPAYGAMVASTGTAEGSAPRAFCPATGSGEYWIIPSTYQASATSVGHKANYLHHLSAKHLSGAGSEIGNGLVVHNDGNTPYELGWLDRPTVIATQGAAGGPAAGSRNYVAVFEHIGADGLVHYSETSPVCNWTNTGGNRVSVSVTYPAINGRSAYAQSRCLIYRTAANGTSYHLLTILSGTVPAFTVSPFPVSYAVYTDSMSDADLVSKPIMYRQPGISGAALDRHPPLSSQAMCAHKDRIVYANGTSVYYSSFAVDAEAPWFNPAFSIYVPGGTGDITGLAAMDGQLFIFKKDGVWVVDGDGPPENGGTGTEFSPPRRLRTEFGCVDQRTIVVTPIGIMYRSGRGIELLSPNGQVQWIGEAVKDTVDSNPYSGGACLDRTNSRVMFPMGDTAGTYPGLLTYNGLGTQNGITAVYDLSSGAWTTAKYRGSSGQPGAYVQDYVYSRYDGEDMLVSLGAGGLCRHDQDNFLDNAGTEYSEFTLETGWIKWDSIQERIRVTDLLILAKKATNHNLAVSVAYDYSDTYSYTKTWTPADINGLSLEQLELQVPKQSVQAVRFKITDSAPADTGTYPITTGKGPEILGLTVKMGLKGGGAKLASGSKG